MDNVLRELYERTIRDRRIVTVLMEVTHRCNLKCRHCYIKTPQSQELDTGEICRILDAMAGHGVMFVAFTGGEPYLRDDFGEILSYASRKRFSVRIMSNATLIGEKEVETIERAGVYEVGISLYGDESGLHDTVTGCAGSFDRTIGAMRLLRRAGVRVAAKVVVMDGNAERIGAIGRLCERIGVTMRIDPTVFPCDNGCMDPVGLRVMDGALTGMIVREYVKGTGKIRARGPVCEPGRGSLCVGPDGLVFPCLELKWPAGRLPEDDFDGIVESLYESPELSVIAKLDNLYDCRQCDSAEYCARCPGLALAEDGDVLGRSGWACHLADVLRDAMNLDDEAPADEMALSLKCDDKHSV